MADSSSELHLEIETLERKHAENPEGRFFVPLANAYRKMGDVETAEALLRGGVERHPDYLSAHIVLGRCLADRGALTEAEEEFRYVLSRDPQNLIALRTLGELAAADGRPTEASEWYRELLAVDPMNEEARQALDTLGSLPDSAAQPAAGEAPRGEDWWKEPSSGDVPQVEGLEATSFGGPIHPEPDVEAVEGEDAAIDTPVEATVVWSDEPVGFQGDEGEIAEDPDEEGPFAVSAPEVVTETIAELYTRQGLHERAAEVYRELIRRRGGDAALEARLAKVERMARGESEPAAEGELVLTDEEALPTPPLDGDAGAGEEAVDVTRLDGGWGAGWDTPAHENDDDPFAASVADGLSALHLDEDPDAEAGQEAAWTVDGSAVGGGDETDGTIADLLGSIARWRPASTAVAGAESAGLPPIDTHQGEDLGSSAEPAPGEALGELAGPTGEDTDAVLDDLSFLAPDEDVAVPSGTAPADDEPFPWEITGPDTAETPALDTDSGVTEAAADETLSWRAAPEATPPAGDPGGEEGRDRPAPRADAVDDEDLESFQAWLRSLKR